MQPEPLSFSLGFRGFGFKGFRVQGFRVLGYLETQ